MLKVKAKPETNHGFTKPEFNGTGYGEVYGTYARVATGKRFSMDTLDRGTIWIPIKESRFIPHWVWNGDQWLTAEQWEAIAIRTAPKGTRFPSKNDTDFSGAPAKKYPKKVNSK